MKISVKQSTIKKWICMRVNIWYYESEEKRKMNVHATMFAFKCFTIWQDGKKLSIICFNSICFETSLSSRSLLASSWSGNFSTAHRTNLHKWHHYTSINSPKEHYTPHLYNNHLKIQKNKKRSSNQREDNQSKQYSCEKCTHIFQHRPKTNLTSNYFFVLWGLIELLHRILSRP